MGSPLVYRPQKALTYVLHAKQPLQAIDGFGVNVTPAQWRGGNLRGALDRLTDVLGGTIVRLDCVGQANWLDPSRRDSNLRYDIAYLRSVYQNPTFLDCWETYRYLQKKPGVEVYLSISGRIPTSMAGSDGRSLGDVSAYAQMVATMAWWARTQEHLTFRSIDPLNETDLGFPEGPKIHDLDLVNVVRAVLKELDTMALTDVTLIGPSDTHVSLERFALLLANPDLSPRFRAFSSHTYGNGHDQEDGGWYTKPTPTADLVLRTRSSPFRHVGIWMNEYGDLDQSGRLEFEVAWRSTRRLLKSLADGCTAAMAWDGFDNQHEHDGAWSTYGLLSTDATTWTYAPKPRFYAAQHIYKYVRPGWRRVNLVPPPGSSQDPFSEWHDPSRNLLLSAFLSLDAGHVTVVGQSQLDGDTQVEVEFRGAPSSLLSASMTLLVTTYEHARFARPVQVANGKASFAVPYRSIFTLTTLPAL